MAIKSSQSQDAILNCPGNKKKVLFGKIPARYVLTACLFAGNAVSFSHRVNLTIAIVAMVNHTASDLEMVIENGSVKAEPSCPYPENDEETSESGTHIQEGYFDWNPSTQGIVLGGFYYGYILTQVAGGRLSERFAPKLIFLLCNGISSLLTLLVPFIAELNFGLFVALRVITGAVQGFGLPASYNFVASWMPNRERSLHLAIVMSGSLLGTVISLPIAGYLCQNGFAGGWPSVFYCFGIFGLLYLIPCFFLMYNSPQEHPRISTEELLYIEQGVMKKSTKKLPVPWSKALTSIPIWALAFSRFTSAFAFHVVMTKIPTYLDVILHYPVAENGLLSSLLYILELVAQVFSGFLSDMVQHKKWLSTNATRKVFQTIASTGAAVCLLVVPFVKCDGTAVIALLAGALGILGLNSGGEMPVIADMAPAFSGSLFGLTNSCASATGFLAPMIAGAFLDGHDGSIKHWSYIFYLSSGLCFAGGLTFLFLGEAKRQAWAEVPETDDSHPKTKELEKY